MRAKPWLKAQTGVWYIQIGKKQHPLGRDKAKAHTLANKLIREASMQRGELPPGGYTFGELLDLYADDMQKHKAASSYEAKRYFIDALHESDMDEQPAELIKPLQITKFLDKQTRIKSPTTRHTRITFLVAMYKWGKKMGIVTSNPLEDMPKPTPLIRQTHLVESRFQEFLDHCGGGNFGELCRVSLESGMRAQEIFKTTAAHFDGEKLVFEIINSKGKKRSRVVFLPGDLKDRVAKLCQQHPEGPIFRHSRGEPWTKDSVSKRMRAIGEKMKVKGLCLTALRHSYCHWRLTKGKQDAATIAKLMGHVDSRMVETRYGHVEGSDHLAEEADKLSMPLKMPSADKRGDEGGSPKPAA